MSTRSQGLSIFSEAQSLDVYVILEAQAYGIAWGKIVRFWRLLRDLGLNSESPEFLDKKPHYGVPLKKLPPDFKSSLLSLLAWLLADWVKDRPSGKHVRPVTAAGIQATVCMLFGFALEKFPKMVIMTVSALFVQPIIEAYVGYAKNDRHVDGFYLRKRLQALCSALRAKTKVPDEELAWFKELMATLPAKIDRDKIQSRKRRTRVDHKDLRRIPGKIREARDESIRRGSRRDSLAYALSLRNELLITWLLYLPWRQKNIRSMRLGVNLFHSCI